MIGAFLVMGHFLSPSAPSEELHVSYLNSAGGAESHSQPSLLVPSDSRAVSREVCHTSINLSTRIGMHAQRNSIMLPRLKTRSRRTGSGFTAPQLRSGRFAPARALGALNRRCVHRCVKLLIRRSLYSYHELMC